VALAPEGLTHLLNGANDLVIVPNSDLAKARLANLSSPQRSHGVSLTVRFLPNTRRPLVFIDFLQREKSPQIKFIRCQLALVSCVSVFLPPHLPMLLVVRE
jgi:hypothetical protein